VFLTESKTPPASNIYSATFDNYNYFQLMVGDCNYTHD